MRGDGKQATVARFGEKLYRSVRVLLSGSSENRRKDSDVHPKPSPPRTIPCCGRCQRRRPAPLILRWEQSSMDRLFATEYQRFQRSRQDLPQVREIPGRIFNRKLSARTERRYRSPTSSQPHVDALIQLTLTNVTRYSDSIRMRRVARSDRGALFSRCTP
jgi:hypothetical protein